VVAVVGKVRRPGLVRVPPGSRVADTLDAAGGVLPGVDLAGVNLARKVGDGEQVAVGVPPAPDAVPATGGEPEAAGPGKAPLDLNAATVEQLDALPGVGPVTAQRIVDWRVRNGRFATVEQLREVEGIGERRLGQLRGLVRT
jgi:competence protein ComEA